MGLHSSPLWIPLGKAKAIDLLVEGLQKPDHKKRGYQQLVRQPSDDDQLEANLTALYRELWAPIEQALPSQIKRLIISPDGQLNFISFATLLNKDKQFLAQRYGVQYVASGREIHSPYVLHLATHGFFAKEDPTQRDPTRRWVGRVSLNRGFSKTRCTAAG